jgi:hypothetical protein
MGRKQTFSSFSPGWRSSDKKWKWCSRGETNIGGRQMVTFAAIVALFGAVIGGLLSVLASVLAQRVQARSQWFVQEFKQRQHLYSEFVEAASCCFADALQQNEPETDKMAKLYAEVGRMQLRSSEPVIREANRIAHKILDTFACENRSRAEVANFLSHDTIDLFSDFGAACRAELSQLRYLREAEGAPM